VGEEGGVVVDWYGNFLLMFERAVHGTDKASRELTLVDCCNSLCHLWTTLRSYKPSATAKPSPRSLRPLRSKLKKG